MFQWAYMKKYSEYTQVLSVCWAYTLCIEVVCLKYGNYIANIEKTRENLGIINRFFCYIPNHKKE